MNVGIFSDSINIPPKEGINVHTYQLACELAAIPGIKVLLVVCDRGWLDLSILDKQPFDTLVLPSDKFYDINHISGIIDTFSLDVLQTYMVYFAATVLGSAAYIARKPMVLEVHDLEKEVAPIYQLDPKAAAFHDNLQYRAACLASAVRVMSAFDYSYCVHTWPELKAKTLWMPVSLLAPPTRARSSKLGMGALFIGNTSYPPNAAAAEFITTVLAPQLTQVTFSLVGRGTEKYSGVNIKAYGPVDDITPIKRKHAIGLAPIFEGSGMKIKLLDYLSAGLPVLTTPLGAQGYPESAAIMIEVATSKWAGLLRSLLADTPKLTNLSVVAAQTFRKHFDLSQNVHELVRLYKGLAYSPLKQPQDFPNLAVNQSDIYWLKEVRETPRKPVMRQQLLRGRL